MTMNQRDNFVVLMTYPRLAKPPRGKLNKAVIVHLTALKGFSLLPLSKVIMWQHGQHRSSACQPLNKNSSCSPTIGGLLEVSSSAMTERGDGETESFCLSLLPSTHICIPSSLSCQSKSFHFCFFLQVSRCN